MYNFCKDCDEKDFCPREAVGCAMIGSLNITVYHAEEY